MFESLHLAEICTLTSAFYLEKFLVNFPWQDIFPDILLTLTVIHDSCKIPRHFPDFPVGGLPAQINRQTKNSWLKLDLKQNLRVLTAANWAMMTAYL